MIRRRWLAAALFLFATGLIVAGRRFTATEYSATTGTPPLYVATGPAVAMFRGDAARTGEEAGPGPATAPVVRWRVSIGGPVEAAPVIVDGVAYVAGRGYGGRELVALDTRTGAERWRFNAGGMDSYEATAVVDGVVYTKNAGGGFSALDAPTGKERWRSATCANDAPAVAAGLVYVGCKKDLVALDAGTGKRRWKHRIDDTKAFGTEVLSSPAVANGLVYIGSQDHHLYALDAATGAERWRVPLGAYTWQTPVVADGFVFIADQAGDLYQIEATTGTLVRQVHLGAARPMAIVDGVLYTLAYPDTVRAIDIATWSDRWTFDAPDSASWSVTIAAGVAYVWGLDNALDALDAQTGQLRWHVHLVVGHATYSTPAILGGTIFVGANDGYLYAFGDADGAGSPSALTAGEEGRPLGTPATTP